MYDAREKQSQSFRAERVAVNMHIKFTANAAAVVTRRHEVVHCFTCSCSNHALSMQPGQPHGMTHVCACVHEQKGCKD